MPSSYYEEHDIDGEGISVNSISDTSIPMAHKEYERILR